MLFLGFLCVFLVWILLASANSGIALALLAERLKKVELIVRLGAILVYWGGITASIGMGRAPLAAFSDRNLRRYPLTGFQRKIVRHLTGLLDPVWVCCLATGWGLSIGLASQGHLALLNGFMATFLLVICGYLTSTLLLTIIERFLSTTAGTTLFALIALGFTTGVSWLLTSHQSATIFQSQLLNFMPSGIAAAMMLKGAVMLSLPYIVFLMMWCVALWAVIGIAERYELRKHGKRSDIGVMSESRRSFGFSDTALSSLIKRSFLYHLRCNRVRLGLIIAIPVLYIYNQWMGGKQGPAGIDFGSLAAFFLLGFCATRAVTLNQFGYDGAGFKRYLSGPVSPDTVLFSNSIVSVLLGWALIIPALLIFSYFGGISHEPRWIALLIGSGVAGGLFFNACGVWTSIFSPRHVVFNKIMGNDMSLAGNVVLFAGFLASFGAAYWSSEQFQFSSVLSHWLYAPIFVLAAAALYGLSVMLGARALKSRKAILTAVVTAEGEA